MRRVGNASGVHLSTSAEDQLPNSITQLGAGSSRSERARATGIPTLVPRNRPLPAQASPEQRDDLPGLSKRGISIAEFERQLNGWVNERGFENERNDRILLAKQIHNWAESGKKSVQFDEKVTSLPNCIKHLPFITWMECYSDVKAISIPELPPGLEGIQITPRVTDLRELPETLISIKIHCDSLTEESKIRVYNSNWHRCCRIEKKASIRSKISSNSNERIFDKLEKTFKLELQKEIDRKKITPENEYYCNSSIILFGIYEGLEDLLSGISHRNYRNHPEWFFKNFSNKIPFVEALVDWCASAETIAESDIRVKVIERVADITENDRNSLNLSNIELSTLPDCIVENENIKKLYIDNNLLTSLKKLPINLVELSACGTLLTTIPSLPSKLRTLYLTENPNLVKFPSLTTDLVAFRWNETSALTINSIERAWAVCDPVPINDNLQPSNLYSSYTTQLDQPFTHETRPAPSESDSIYYEIDDAEFSEALYLQSVYDLQSDHADRLASEARPSNSHGLTQWRQPAFPNARIPRTLGKR